MVSLALTRAFVQQGPPPAALDEERERFRYLQLKAKAGQAQPEQAAPADPLAGATFAGPKPTQPEPVQKQPDDPWNEQLADLLDQGADSLVGMVRGQGGRDSIREGLMVPLTEGMARLPSLALRDPKAAFEAVDPAHMAHRAFNLQGEGTGDLLRGDLEGAAENYIGAATEGMGAALTVGGVRVGAPKGPPSAKAAVRDAGKTLATTVSKDTIRPQAMEAIGRILEFSGVPADRVALGLRRIVDLVKEGGGRAATVAQLLQREFADPTRPGGPEFPQVIDNINTVIRERGLSKDKRLFGKADASPTIVRETTQGMRATQVPFLEQSAERNLGSNSRMATRDEVAADLKRIGDEAYKPLLAAPVDAARAKTIQDVLNGPGMEKYLQPMKDEATSRKIDVETMIAQDPVRAAHNMQMSARALAEEAERAGQTNRSRIYTNIRNNILETIDDLEVPGQPGRTYKDIRKEYSDEAGIDTALNAADQFGSVARNPEKLDNFIRSVGQMTQDQGAAALLSVRDWVKAQLAGPPEDAPVRLGALMSRGVLQALDQLGPAGRAVAEDIRAIRRENEFLGATTNRNQSATQPNIMSAQEGPALYSRGGIGGAAGNLLGDAALMATGATQAPLLTLMREGPKIYSGMMKPFIKTKEDMTRVLMAKQPENALGSKPPPPIGPQGGKGKAPKPMKPKDFALMKERGLKAVQFREQGKSDLYIARELGMIYGEEPSPALRVKASKMVDEVVDVYRSRGTPINEGVTPGPGRMGKPETPSRDDRLEHIMDRLSRQPNLSFTDKGRYAAIRRTEGADDLTIWNELNDKADAATYSRRKPSEDEAAKSVQHTINRAMSRDEELAQLISEARFAQKSGQPKAAPTPGAGGGVLKFDPQAAPNLSVVPAQPKPSGGEFNFSKEPQVKRIGGADIEYGLTPDGKLLINYLEVDPAVRGEGHASRALDKILKAADDEGLETVLYIEDDSALNGLGKRELQKFYGSRGFKLEEGLDDFDNPIDDYMIRPAQNPKRPQPKPSTPLTGGRARDFDSLNNEVGSLVYNKTPSGDYQIEGARITMEAERGKGKGIELYERLVAKAAQEGKAVFSDNTISPDALRVYEALKRRGYNIEQVNRAKTNKNNGALESTSGKPIFKISPPDKPPLLTGGEGPKKTLENLSAQRAKMERAFYDGMLVKLNTMFPEVLDEFPASVPFKISQLRKENWSQQSVPASKVVPTQPSVNKDFTEAAARHAGTDYQFPLLVKHNGKYYVREGHHRLVDEAFNSKDGNIKARVIDLDAGAKPSGGDGPPAARVPQGPPKNALASEPAKPPPRENALAPKQRLNTRASIKDAPQEYRDAVMKAPEGISQAEWDRIRRSTGNRLPKPSTLYHRMREIELKGNPTAAELRELEALTQMKARLEALRIKYD